jgi:hypothetical protein
VPNCHSGDIAYQKQGRGGVGCLLHNNKRRRAVAILLPMRLSKTTRRRSPGCCRCSACGSAVGSGRLEGAITQVLLSRLKCPLPGWQRVGGGGAETCGGATEPQRQRPVVLVVGHTPGSRSGAQGLDGYSIWGAGYGGDVGRGDVGRGDVGRGSRWCCARVGMPCACGARWQWGGEVSRPHARRCARRQYSRQCAVCTGGGGGG